MTEDEAKTKWCPYARLGDCERGFGHNRWDDPSAHPSHTIPRTALCIGAACMAWSFHEQTFSRPTELWSKSKNKKVCSAYSDDAEWRPVTGNADDEPPAPHGYCNLMQH